MEQKNKRTTTTVAINKKRAPYKLLQQGFHPTIS